VSVEGLLSTTNEFVTITDPDGNFNNIDGAGGIMWSSDEFEIFVNSDYISGTEINFTLTASNNLPPFQSWSSSISFPIEPMIVSGHFLDDDSNPDSNGNNNGIIEAGETIEITPYLNNVSSQTFSNNYGRLNADYSFVDIWDNQQGTSGMVYDMWPINWNTTTNEPRPIGPGSTVFPRYDYVFDYNADTAYELLLDVIMTSDVSINDAITTFKYKASFLVNEGQPPVLSIHENQTPSGFVLHQAFPNPFNPVTTLRYDLPEKALVTIVIYDLLGGKVKTLVNTTQDAGFKSVIWDATNDYGKPVSAGVYLYKIQAGEFVQTRKMVLLK
jgi:hypothetical protein